MGDKEKQKLTDELANWIDRRVIAELIVQHLDEQGEELTLGRGKEVWLGTLENLGAHF